MTPEVLAIRNMQISRGREGQAYLVALPSLTVCQGDVLAIVGASGCGKSTLLEAIGLILQPEHVEQFRFLETELSGLTRDSAAQRELVCARLRLHSIGYVPQTGGLLPYLSVRQNIVLPASMAGRSVDQALFVRLLERLKLDELLNRMPRELSIGERQRVSFARAVVHQPSLLLADEPTAALDPHLAQELFNLILEIVQELNLAALIVTHEWSIVATSGIRKLAASVQLDQRTVFHEQ